MASYTFETITPAQALAYSATDTLTFQSTSLSASQLSVAFIPGGVTVSETVAITANGLTVTFGAPLEGEIDITMGDTSILYIGGPGADADPRPGSAKNDAFFGNTGNDSFTGGAGHDLFQGNQGSDTMSGGAGDDTLYGGQDNDQLTTGDGRNFAQGNLGNDTVTGGSEADSLYGGKGDDNVIGGGGGDYMNGNLGNDSLVGGVGSDNMFGEDGTDTLVGGAWSAGLPNGARDQLTGGAGADRFVFAAGDSSTLAGNGDQIMDWASEDSIAFTGNPAGTALNYMETTAATYADALTAANTAIAAGTFNYVAVAVGADVVLFADLPAAGDGTADLAVVLIGRTLADIDFSDIVV
jgi:Ca2+-binding RTX toxin-like protein